MPTGYPHRVLARKEGVGLLLPLMLFFRTMTVPGVAAALTDLRLFDAHVHYNRDAWEAVSADEAIAILDRAGVDRALVSSTPDDGTLRLWEKAPGRIIPELRPYRSTADRGTWTKDPSVLEYVRERLKRGIYRGIGEFHLDGEEGNDPVPRGFVELASRYGIVLHCHCDEPAIRDLADRGKGIPVLWAHAGMGSSPQTISNLLDTHANLWVELSMRFDIAPGGNLLPAWRDLFLRHPDRILVGTDTWINPQWSGMPEILDAFRNWLRQLPPDVGKRIARENGDRLFPP